MPIRAGLRDCGVLAKDKSCPDWQPLCPLADPFLACEFQLLLDKVQELRTDGRQVSLLMTLGALTSRETEDSPSGGMSVNTRFAKVTRPASPQEGAPCGLHLPSGGTLYPVLFALFSVPREVRAPPPPRRLRWACTRASAFSPREGLVLGVPPG